jgi:hypothetical protein
MTDEEARSITEERRIWLDKSKLNEILKQEALDLSTSVRGKYIISKALTIAIKELEKKPKPYQESSDIEDMEFLKRHFNVYNLHIF